MISVPVMIIGSGLVGASIGCALTRKGTEVHLYDADRSHAVVAASRGAGSVEPIDPDKVGLVVVAVPPQSIPQVVADALATFRNATVTDVGSVKGKIVERLESQQVDLSRYVGSHPMAGSQLSGPITANPDLFTDRTWVIAPTAHANLDAVRTVELLAESCGARIVRMPVTEHDEAVAQISHVPQIMSSLTAAHLRGIPKRNLELAGQGIKDVTRIAGSDPEMWRQIILANSGPIRRELLGVLDDLKMVIDSLDDPDVVEDFLADGRDWARSLPGKHGFARSDYLSVIIQIPDEPGALARLFADIEQVGVNVEDLSIEHDARRTVGYLAVQVEPGLADKLQTAMVEKGWSLRS